MTLGDFARGFRPNHPYERYRIDALEVALHNMIEIAEVTAVNHEKMKVTVKAKAGELTGLDVFVLGQGSADYQEWIPPVPGDKVLLLADSGNLNGAYCLPIRLPAAFNSDIPAGAIVKAGDLTIQYNKEANTYKISLGDNNILLTEGKVELVSDGNKVLVDKNHINLQTTTSNISLEGAACDISVPGGIVSIGPAIFTFNGKAVLLAP